jgi:glycerol-1-phosphate dehydrogenase [NAD(P)+]
VRLADGINERTADAIGALMEALVAVGILMAYVGNSRPASGSEHHLSHYFEIVGIVRGEEYLPHGIDVCCSAIETAKLREKLIATGDEYLEEGTLWHDNEWGNCRCANCTHITGRNKLGKILMQVRDELNNGTI